MSTPTFHIATLHRGRFMLLLLAGVCLITAFVSRMPIQEIAKILAVLISLPFLIFLSTKWSKAPSVWTINQEKVTVESGTGTDTFMLGDIKYIRNLPRSGGNLLMIFFHKEKAPRRYWRNKLFQQADDLDAMIHAFRQRGIEYYYM
jgi:hypothetical protein